MTRALPVSLPTEKDKHEYLALFQKALVFFECPPLEERAMRLGIAKGFFEACRWYRDRMKPVAKLTDEDVEAIVSDALSNWHFPYGDEHREMVSAAAALMVRAAERRILGGGDE